MNTPRAYILLGRGSAGKTETATAARELKLPVIELGQLIRSAYRKGDPAATKIVTQFMLKGKYFPSRYSIAFLKQTLDQNFKQFSNGFIVNGFPRTLEGVYAFEKLMQEQGFRVGGVVEFKIPRKTSIRRQTQLSQRPTSIRKNQSRTEIEQAIIARQHEFDLHEKAVISHYRKRGLVETVPMQLRGRKRKIPESKKPSELENPRFLRQKARRLLKAIHTLQKRK